MFIALSNRSFSGRPHRVIAALALGAMLATAVTPVLAANVAPRLSGAALTTAEASRKALFAQMLADPGNVTIALNYARLSADVGDLEAAVSTLERLLVFSPQMAELNYELGGLYLRLGAFTQASTYFAAAANAPDATPELKAKAAALVSRTEQQASGDYVTGSISSGLRYQTNANSGIAASTIDLNGIPFSVSPSTKADDDVNAYLTLGLKASKDLASQGDRWDTQLSVYASAYRDHGEINTLSGELQTGPVFNLARIGIHDASLGVYGIAGAMTLDGTPYLYTLGAGTQIILKPAPQTTLSTRLEYRFEAFQDSAARPSVSDMSGSRIRLTTDARQQVGDMLTLYSSLYAERNEGQVGRQSDWEAGATGGARVALGGSFGAPWIVDVSAGLAGRQFDVADPVYSTERRADLVGIVKGVVTAPLGGNWAAVGTLSYQKQLSNYDLYSFDNIATSLALSKGF